MIPTLAHTSDLLALLGEPTRVRLLSLLADQEMTVVDLAAATDLGQSRVSTHLGRLRAARMVVDRKAGSAVFYSLNEGGMPAEARRVWTLVAGEVHDATLEQDRRRWKALSEARDSAASWPDAVAGHMDRHYSPGRTWESLTRGLVGLLALGDVLDAGGGDGAVAELLTARSKSYTLVDHNERLVRAARRRLAERAAVVRADLARLPFAAPRFDLALALNVLVEVDDPPGVLAAIAGVLRPGGRIAVVTLAAHDHADVAAGYRHKHLGFAPATVRRLLIGAGFSVESCAVTSRERRPPRLQVVTAFGRK